MNIINTINEAYKKFEQSNWEKIYWVIDLHGTIIGHTDKKDINIVPPVYPHVEPVLSLLSQRGDICLILNTSTSRTHLEKTLEYLKKLGIKFDYINENPESRSSEFTDYSKKYYYDILLDDKAGFEPEDWWEIELFVINYYGL